MNVDSIVNTGVKPLVLPLGRPWRELRHYASLDSTQRAAARMAAAGEDLRGVVIWAETQTAGHGRQGRGWMSEAGGLYVTAGLPGEWKLGPAWLGWMPLLAALDCARLVEERWGVEARLKWPNDVIVGGKKLAGVLGEVYRVGIDETAARQVLLIGLGLNWGNRIDEAAKTAGLPATALIEHAPGLKLEERQVFLSAWLERLAGHVERMQGDVEGAIAEVRADAEGLLWKRGEKVRLQHTEEGVVQGRLMGLGLSGGALLLTEDGVVREVACGSQEIGGEGI
jgi:BirA family biotin operon repressor/biotin-[acetyl-CoA-carboxylase] ligase